MARGKREEIKIVSSFTTPIHELANEHRKMTDIEFEALKQSIEEEGQLYPVVLYRGRIVDGRHRQKALQELEIQDMKAIELPHKMPLDEVRNKVLGTEVRRTDTVAQKAIRAYLWLEKAGEDATQDQAAKKFAVGRAEVSRAKKLFERLGSELMMKWYQMGHIWIGGKKYTTLQKVINALDGKGSSENKEIEIPEEVREVRRLIDELASDGKIAEIAMIESYAKSMRKKVD